MDSSGGWKLYLTAPPVDGKANEACIHFLAKELHIPRSKVRLISGIKSRKKVFAIDGITDQEFRRLLG